MRRLLSILTVCSAIVFLTVAALLTYTNYRCRTDARYRPSFDTDLAGSNYEFYAAPAGLGLTVKHAGEPKRVTDAMTLQQWQDWSLANMETDQLHQAAGFSLLVRGTLFRSDLDHATRTITAHNVGWWRALFVPRWAALLLPALLPLIGLARLLRGSKAVTAKPSPAGDLPLPAAQ